MRIFKSSTFVVWTDRCTKGRVGGWTGGKINGCIGGRTNGWMYGQMDEQMDGLKNRWTDRRTDERLRLPKTKMSRQSNKMTTTMSPRG